MAGHGSKPLRGLESTRQSSIQTTKFGRLFRWLEPALAARTPSEEKHIKEMLELLASLMVSSEFSENVDAQNTSPPPTLTYSRRSLLTRTSPSLRGTPISANSSITTLRLIRPHRCNSRTIRTRWWTIAHRD